MTFNLELKNHKLFGNVDAAQENVEDLVSYALKPSIFDQFADEDFNLLIARAYKGEGKSALLITLEKHLGDCGYKSVFRFDASDLSPVAPSN